MTTLHGTTKNDVLRGTNGHTSEFNDILYGYDGNDKLYGHGGNDLLFGGKGDDILFGGVGIDGMAGGQGNDLYKVDHPWDHVMEYGGQGQDTVEAFGNFWLPYDAEVEVLKLSDHSTENLSGSGNRFDNVVLGNQADNWLGGENGNDRLRGMKGNDTLIGGQGDDTLYGGQGDDLILHDFGSDHLYGNKGNDTFRFGEVNDLVWNNNDCFVFIGDFKIGEDKIELDWAAGEFNVWDWGDGSTGISVVGVEDYLCVKLVGVDAEAFKAAPDALTFI